MGPLKRPRHAALVLVFLAGCGGKVIFDTASSTSSGTGGAGGTKQSSECVLGACNDPCTKCTTTQASMTCVQGKCDQQGVCQPPGVSFTCGI